MRATARRAIALVAVVVTAAALGGCATVATTRIPSETSTAVPAPASPERPDPHALRGPSTAASVPPVEPVSVTEPTDLPVTVTDALGREVTIRDTSRVLALDLYGTLADTVIGLGLADRLVGRGAATTGPRVDDLPLVTRNGHDLNAEAILALRPTLVLTDTTIGPREAQRQLEASGVTVVFFSPDRGLDRLDDHVEAVAHALGVDAAGRELAGRIDDELADAAAAIDAMAPARESDRLRMAFLYVRGTAGVFFILGAGTGAHDLIEGIDGVDVAAEAGVEDVSPANAEALLATNPEVILVMSDGLASTGGIEGLLARPGVAETTAGRHRRVVDMADGEVLSFGPNTAAVLLSLARAVYRPGGDGA